MIKRNAVRRIYTSLSVTQKSIIWYTLTSIIQNGILFLITPLYTRLLSDSQYGLFSVYQSWQQIVSIVAVLSLDRCITVGFMKYQEQKKEFLSSVQTLMTVLVLVFSIPVCLLTALGQRKMDLPVPLILVMLPVALMNNTLANWSWLQRYNYDYRKLATVTIFSTVMMQSAALMAITFLPFENRGILLVLSMAGVRILLYGTIYISVFIKGKTFFNREYWKFALRYSVAVIPHALAQIILNSSDRIMIDRMCGREEAAYYGVTYSAAMVLNIVITSISSAVQPWFFSRIREKDFASIRKQTNLLLLASACLSIGISLFAPEILAILAPESYKSALWVFPSIATSVFFNSMYLYFANFESYYEKPHYFSIATVAGAVTNVILNLILIPKFGFFIAGYTTLVCYILFACMHYLFMRKVCCEYLGGIKIFDMTYIIRLSAVTIGLSLGIAILYETIVIRYALILTALLVTIKYRKLIIHRIGSIVCRPKRTEDSED